MKQALFTVLIAVAAAIVVPRDLREASTLVVRAGVVLIQFGVSLHDWYDPGYADDGPAQEHASGLPPAAS